MKFCYSRDPPLPFPLVSFPCNGQQLDLTVALPCRGRGVGVQLQAQLSSVTSLCVSVIYKLYISLCACVCGVCVSEREGASVSPACPGHPPWPRSWYLA